MSIAGLANVRGRLGLPVERDLYFTPNGPLSEYATEAHCRGRIVTWHGQRKLNPSQM